MGVFTMSKTSLSLVLALSALALPAGAALAYDGEGYGHVARDGRALQRDAAQVREEREDVQAARWRLEQAERHGDRRDVARAEAQVNREVREYNAVRNKYVAQRNDYVEDRAEYGEHHRRHWWNRWN
jgi:hypothetical protein